MNDTTTIAFLVTLYGTVQGVGFRARVRRAANQRKIFGWVRNRKAGHVQAHFEGPPQQVRQVLADIQMFEADITDCVISKAQPCAYADFQIVKTSDSAAMAEVLLDAGLKRASVLTLEYVDLEQQFREIMAHIPKSRADDLKHLAQHIPSRFLGEPLVQRQKILPFALKDFTCSFACEAWSQKVMNSAMSRAGTKSAEALLDDKTNGQAFARLLGLRVPNTYQNGVSLAEVRPRQGIVVKPSRAASSKGVYSFLSNDAIYNLGANTALSSFAEFIEDAKKIPDKLGRPDSWMVEELILNEDGFLPNDLKMLTFYGEVALVQEATRLPTRICYYNRDGHSVRTGRYEDRAFEGTGVPAEYIDLAEKISLKVPIPFMRIDFLKSAEGPVFGEFTPKPGNFQGFDAPTDARLGRCYAEARGRLMADLLKGKAFEEYNAFLVAHKAAKSQILSG